MGKVLPHGDVNGENPPPTGKRGQGIPHPRSPRGPVKLTIPSDEGLNGASTNVESRAECALYVAKDALEQRKVRLAGIVHE
jgi:hypothetical protein